MILSQEEQKQKISEYKKSLNEKIIADIVIANSKIIKKLARLFLQKNQHISYDDLYSSGVEGLILAINKYDSSKNDAFLPYAKLWIKAKMQEYIKSVCSSVTISGRNGRKLFSNYFRYLHEIEESGLTPNIINVAEKASCKENEVKHFIHAMFPSSSIYHEYEDREEERIPSGSGNIELEYDKNKAMVILNNEVKLFSQNLTDNEKMVWQKRCFNSDPLSIPKLASSLGVTQQQTLSIERSLMKKFKKKILNSPNKELFHTIIENV